MQIKTLAQGLVLATAIAGLAGCNLVGKSTAAGNGATAVTGATAAQAAQDASATTYGLNSSSSIQGQNGTVGSASQVQNAAMSSDQRVQNSMRAPENQTYYFAFNSFVVNQSDIPYIDAQAHYLVQHPKAKVRLEGNTDNRGSREYNIGLGWKRDQSVQRILEQQGVNSSQIAMVSYGKERPAVMGDTEAAWALNRRVNLVYEGV